MAKDLIVWFSRFTFLNHRHHRHHHHLIFTCFCVWNMKWHQGNLPGDCTAFQRWRHGNYVLLFAKIPPNHSPLHHDRMNAFVNKPLETPRPRYYADLYFLTSTVTNSVMIPFRCSPWAAVIDANPSGARAIPICWYLIHKGQNSQCHFMLVCYQFREIVSRLPRFP